MSFSTADQSADAGFQHARTGVQVAESLNLADSALQPAQIDTLAKLNGVVTDANVIADQGAFRNAVVTGTGALTRLGHSGRIVQTTGDVTIPNTADDVGFSCVLIAGGSHTVTFNGTTSAAMAAGDMMTVIVESTTQIRAVLTIAADQVVFA